MTSNNKAPGVRNNSNSVNQRPAPARQSTPGVTQLKSGNPAQTIKRPVAPPVFRPQPPKAVVVQSKTAAGSVNRKPPAATSTHPAHVPKAPQVRSSAAQSPNATPAARGVTPVYRPQAKKIVQPKMISQGQRPATAPHLYRPEQRQAGTQSRQPVLRPQAIQCSIDQLPPELAQSVARHLDPQSIGNLRLTNQNTAQDLDRPFRRQNLDQWLLPGNLEHQYPVDEYNYNAICDQIAATGGLPPWVAHGIRTNIDQFLALNPGGDPTDLFWNDIRGNLARQQIHQLITDPQFTGLFGRASFLRRWRNTLVVGGAAVALGVGVYLNRNRLF